MIGGDLTLSVNDFIPELWSEQVLQVLLKALVYADLANHKWEGEIKNMGDKVHINSVGPIDIFNYQKNETNLLSNLQVLDSYGTTLEITQCPAFNFQVDDVDRAQACGDFQAEAMRRSAWGLRDHVDRFLANRYPYSGSTVSAGTDSNGIIPLQVNSVNAFLL